MTPGLHLSKARRALASARLLLSDGDTDGACNRAYYAMFDVATAALVALEPEVNPEGIRTHNGLLSAFGRFLVKTGRLDGDLGRALNQVERIRLLADYTGQPIDWAKANWAVDEAERFLANVSAFVLKVVNADG